MADAVTGPAVDIAIVGGGVVGWSVAWWLTGHHGFDGSVAVFDPDPGGQSGATGRSLGSLRQQFSTPENILLSRFGLSFIRDLPRHLATEADPAPDVQFRDGHYLFLATDAGADSLRANVETQQATGAPVTGLMPDDLRARFPWLNTNDIAYAAFGERDEGWLDPHALRLAFRRAALAQGVKAVPLAGTALRRVGSAIAAIDLADGSRVTVGQVVNAAGPWAGAVAATAGVALPVVPRRRTVFHVTAPEPPSDPILIVDPSGVYVRPEGNGYLTGSSPLDGEPDPDGGELEPTYSQFEERCWPALAHRSPRFEALRMQSAWAGYYDTNSFDHNAVLGPHPTIGNLFFANGFSGHGLQQAPAVGRALAEWLLTGRSTSLNLDCFAFERIAAGKPLIERGII